jgi:hypothetical protein
MSIVFFVLLHRNKNIVIEHKDGALFATAKRAGVQSSKRYDYNCSILSMNNIHIFIATISEVTWTWEVNHHKHHHSDNVEGKDS